ncbi:MAG: ABC transporter substrate-binding protein [Arachnia sp.]
MFTRRIFLASTAAAVALAGCSTGDPLAGQSPGEAGQESDGAAVVTVGSAGFAESEILAEIYAQSLEANGYTVERRMQIGSREAYIAALDDGSIDFIPEYSGNLLQYYNPDSDAASSQDVEAALRDALPEGMRVLEASLAEDADSWCVTAEFSQANGITSLADLAGYEGELRIAGNPELAERPYGPLGLTQIYGVPAEQMSFTPIDDSGGPLTVEALTSGEVDLADIFSTTPAIADEGLVVLEDPENMIAAQNVLPLLSDRVPSDVEPVLDAVSAELTTDDLITMNARNSGDEKASPATIAADWLAERGLS